MIRHRWLGALLAGSALTVAGLGVAVLSRPLGQVLFWPVVGLARLAGPGYNIGTPEQPLYEATPVDLLAMAVGLLLSWVFYVLVAYVVLWRMHIDRVERAVSGSPYRT